MSRQFVPTSLDQITPDLITTALRTSGFSDVSVASLSFERIAVGDGFLGELARLSIEYANGAGPVTAIAKIPTTDPGMKPVGDMLDVYGREHRAYAKLIPHMQMRTPQAYFNVSDEERGAYCLILEDIGHLPRGDQHAGGTLQQAQSAIVAAAGLHGRWWNRVSQIDWLPSPADHSVAAQGMLEAGWPMIIDQHGEQLGPVAKQLESFLPTISDALTASGAQNYTLTHGDFRLDNMFFDGDELVMIDWQLIEVGSGIRDVVWFLTGNLDPEMRRAHESELISSYRNTLEKMDAGYVHLEDLMNAYRLSLNGILCTALFGSVTAEETTKRGEELWERMISRMLDAYVEHEAWELIGAHGVNPQIR